MPGAPPPVSPRPRAKKPKPPAVLPKDRQPKPPAVLPKDRQRSQTASTPRAAIEVGEDANKSPGGMDAARRRAMAYEYLCHLEEARQWMQACLQIANKLEKEKKPDKGEDLTPEQKQLLAKTGSKEELFTKELTDATTDESHTEEVTEEEDKEEELPPASELEEALRNGVLLARIALWFAAENVSKRHTYDLDEKVYKEKGLVFRHTENVNQWLKAMKKKNFPDVRKTN